MAKILLEPFNLVLPIHELEVNVISPIFKDEEGNAFKKTYYKLLGPNNEEVLVKREDGNADVPSSIARLIDNYEEQESFTEEEILIVDSFLVNLHPEMQTRKS